MFTILSLNNLQYGSYFYSFASNEPVFSSFFLIVLLASIALPLTNGFIGEFLLINGIFQFSTWMAAVAGLTIILGAVYMLSAYQKISLGEANKQTEKFADITLSEKWVLIPLVLMIFWIGIYPDFFLGIAEPSIKALRDVIHVAHGITQLTN